MDELERNNNIKLKFGGDYVVDGIVLDVAADRITMSVNNESLETAKILNDLDKVTALVYTRLGVKTLKSCIISSLDKRNYIVIERTPVLETQQRREFVRINHTFKFSIQTPNQKRYPCLCINISGGGIAFRAPEAVKLSSEDEILIYFPSELFEKDIITKAIILKTNEDCCVAKYHQLNPRDEDKIVKYVFKVMTRSAY